MRNFTKTTLAAVVLTAFASGAHADYLFNHQVEAAAREAKIKADKEEARLKVKVEKMALLKQDDVYRGAMTSGVIAVIMNVDAAYTKLTSHMVSGPGSNEQACKEYNDKWADGAPILPVDAALFQEAISSPSVKKIPAKPAERKGFIAPRLSRQPEFFIKPSDLLTGTLCIKAPDGFRIVQELPPSSPPRELQQRRDAWRGGL